MRVLRRVYVLLFFFLLLPSSVFAATVEFSNAPGTFQKEQEASLDVKIAGAASNTSNYLRAAFYPDSTTSYFGYTFNHLSEWYNGVSPIDPKKFLQIQISPEGTWSGQLKIKPDILSPYFKGNGAYLLKIGRYTANGTSVTDWSQSTEVSIFGVDPTPTATLSPKPTNTPAPTATKTPTPTPSKTPTPTPSKTGTPTPSKKPQEASKDVLGSSTKKDLEVTGKPIVVKGQDSSAMSPIFFVLVGLGIITGACGILLFREWKKQKEEEI